VRRRALADQPDQLVQPLHRHQHRAGRTVAAGAGGSTGPAAARRRPRYVRPGAQARRRTLDRRRTHHPRPDPDPDPDPDTDPGDGYGRRPGDGYRDGHDPRPGARHDRRPDRRPHRHGHRPGDRHGHRPGDRHGHRPGDRHGHRPGDRHGRPPGQGHGRRPGDRYGRWSGQRPGRRLGEGHNRRLGEEPAVGSKKGPAPAPGRAPPPAPRRAPHRPGVPSGRSDPARTVGHGPGDRLGEPVRAGQQDVDHLGRRRAPPGPEFLDQLLQLVREQAHLVQPGDRRGSLEGVDLAEDRPDQGLVVRGDLQLQQQLAELGQPHLRLHGEQGPDLPGVEAAHQTGPPGVPPSRRGAAEPVRRQQRGRIEQHGHLPLQPVRAGGARQLRRPGRRPQCRAVREGRRGQPGQSPVRTVRRRRTRPCPPGAARAGRRCPAAGRSRPAG
jgi:hypothetical protein